MVTEAGMRRPTMPKTSIIEGNGVTSASGTQMKNGAAMRTPSQPIARRATGVPKPRYCRFRQERSAGRFVSSALFTLLTAVPGNGDRLSNHAFLSFV